MTWSATTAPATGWVARSGPAPTISAFFTDTFAGAANSNLSQHTSDSGATYRTDGSAGRLILDGAGRVALAASGTNDNATPVVLAPSTDYRVDLLVRRQTATANGDQINIYGRSAVVTYPNPYCTALVFTVDTGNVTVGCGSSADGTTDSANIPFANGSSATLTLWMQGTTVAAWWNLASVVTQTVSVTTGRYSALEMITGNVRELGGGPLLISVLGSGTTAPTWSPRSTLATTWTARV